MASSRTVPKAVLRWIRANATTDLSRRNDTFMSFFGVSGWELNGEGVVQNRARTYSGETSRGDEWPGQAGKCGTLAQSGGSI